jgi:hypothetical protein
VNPWCSAELVCFYWAFPEFIHIVACMCISSLIMAQFPIGCLFIHSSVKSHLGCFHLLAIVNNASVSALHTNICLSTSFQFFWVNKCLRVELLGHMVILFSTFTWDRVSTM